MILYKQATKTKIKVSDFRMALAMHRTQCHSPEPSNTLIATRNPEERRASVPGTKILQRVL